jgi:hypothetical protein
MTTVLASIPSDIRELFEDVIGQRDPSLLSALKVAGDASPDQRIAVEEVLSSEFSRELRPDYEPTDRGRAIDNLLGQFLLRWPIEAEWRHKASGPD